LAVSKFNFGLRQNIPLMDVVMSERRVVVTGIGTINPIGKNVVEFWENCRKGSSGVRNITDLIKIPPHLSQIAGVVPIPFDKISERAQQRNLLFAETAVQEALQDANLLGTNFKDRCGVFIATAIAEIDLMELSFERNRINIANTGFVSPKSSYFGSSFFFNNVAKNIARKYLCQGGSVTISTGCTGGNDAVGYGLHMIRDGKVDIAIVGAVEAPITPLVIAAFGKIRATSSKRNHDPQTASRPFDKDRDGFVLAEGCGILIIENLEHAQKRNAKIYAEIKGTGSVNNCYHMTDIPQDGISISKACLLALKDAKINPDEIDFINAHGSSTPQNDIAECNAFYRIFGNRAKEIPITSIKSQIGHALSAANAIELISVVLSIRDSIIPPTINLESQDPACPLTIVSQRALNKNVTTVLKTSSGFSGIHSSLVLKKI